MAMSLTKIRKMFRSRAPGKEKPLDCTPIAMPLGAQTPAPISEVIAKLVRQAVESEKEEQFETMDEADDFDMDDDDLLDLSPYEFDELGDEIPIIETEQRSEAEPENLAVAERKPSSDQKPPTDPPNEVESESLTPD